MIETLRILLFNGFSKIDNACKCLKKAEKNTRSTRAMKTVKTRFVQSYACHDKYDFVQKYSASTYNSTHPRYILPARINDSVRHDRVWYMIEKCDRRTLNEIVKHDTWREAIFLFASRAFGCFMFL